MLNRNVLFTYAYDLSVEHKPNSGMFSENE